jgi:hypothetical protein
LLDLLTGRQIGWINGFIPCLRRQITDNGIGFPHHGVTIDDDRHLSRRVKCQEFRAGTSLEAPSIVQALIIDANLIARLEYLAHIEGIVAAKNA